MEFNVLEISIAVYLASGIFLVAVGQLAETIALSYIKVCQQCNKGNCL